MSRRGREEIDKFTVHVCEIAADVDFIGVD
jgi:hypothetical protein